MPKDTVIEMKQDKDGVYRPYKKIEKKIVNKPVVFPRHEYKNIPREAGPVADIVDGMLIGIKILNKISRFKVIR